VVVCYPSNQQSHVADLDFLQRKLVPFAKKARIFILSTSLMPKSISTSNPPSRACFRSTARWTSASNPLDVEDLGDAGLAAWASRVGNERIISALTRVDILSRLRRFTPGAGGRRRRLSTCPAIASRMQRHLSSPRRRAVEASDGPAGTCAAGRLDVRLVADPEPSANWAASNSPSCWSKRPKHAVSPGTGFGERARASSHRLVEHRTGSGSARNAAVYLRDDSVTSTNDGIRLKHVNALHDSHHTQSSSKASRPPISYEVSDQVAVLRLFGRKTPIRADARFLHGFRR